MTIFYELFKNKRKAAVFYTPRKVICYLCMQMLRLSIACV